MYFDEKRYKIRPIISLKVKFTGCFRLFFLNSISVYQKYRNNTKSSGKVQCICTNFSNTLSNLSIFESFCLFFTVAFNLHRAVLDCLCLRDEFNLAGVGASAGASVEVPSYGESYGVIRAAAQGSLLTNSRLRFLARALRLFAAE